MLCQKCKKRTKVTDSRFKEGNIIRTRRCQSKQCDEYNVTFQTKEEVLAKAPKKRRPAPPSPKQRKKARQIKRTPTNYIDWESKEMDSLTDEELEALIGGGYE